MKAESLKHFLHVRYLHASSASCAQIYGSDQSVNIHIRKGDTEEKEKKAFRNGGSIKRVRHDLKNSISFFFSHGQIDHLARLE